MSDNVKKFHKERDEYISCILTFLSVSCFINLLKKQKKENIAKEVFHIVIDLDISSEDLINYKKLIIKINKEKRNSFIFEDGDLFKKMSEVYKDSKFVDFCKKISELTPNGLSKSPNAGCGKWELLVLILQPNCLKEKNKGVDLTIYDEDIDIKGNEIRLYHPHLTGKQYKKGTDKIFEDTKIEPNKINNDKNGNKAYEIEKKCHELHYREEFSKLNKNKKYDLIKKYFKLLDIEDITDNMIKPIFENNSYNIIKLVEIILKDFIKKNKLKWIIYGNGSKVKTLKSVEDLKKFKIKKDYFRIKQDIKIGWYIE